MRTTFDDAPVRLYHLGDDGIATTIAYSTLTRALEIAAGQPVEDQADLYLQTDNDVVSYLGMAEQ